jgi:hypothetical protein
MERNELKQKINEEYEVFKNYILEQPKEEIFNRSAEIDFKTNIKEYLTNDDTEIGDTALENLSLIDGSILDELYGVYIESDTYYTYDDICEEIVELFDTDYSDSAD